MNKNIEKRNTEENYKKSKLNKFINKGNKSIEPISDRKPNYKNLKFRNKKVSPKKEEILSSKSKVIFHINKIFYNIAQYSIKEKDYFISKYQLIDILKQGNIISPEIISLNQTDIILTKLYPHKNKYNFSQFMNFLTELCHFLYQDNFIKSPKKTMDEFLSCLYNNYKEIIIEKNSNNFMEKLDDNSCTLKCIETIISSKLERPIFRLILTLYDNLTNIYKTYFPNEIIEYKSINEEKIIAESSQNLFRFWKDFEIFPSVMSKVNLNLYFNLLMKYLKEKNYINMVIINFGENEKYTDLGIFFKFSSFILCLYHFCIFYNYKRMKFQILGNDFNNLTEGSINYDDSMIDVDKLIFFFKKMENSNGTKKYLLKRGRTNEYRFNFIFKKKDIQIAKYEMELWNRENVDNDFDKYISRKSYLKTKVDKINIDSSPYTSRPLTERKVENEKSNNNYNDIYLLTNNTIKSNNNFSKSNFNKYFLNINKKNDFLISISDLDDILSVSQNVKEEIINKIEKLSEIFLQYSKISNKLEYNRMSFSSFIKFLEDAHLLLVIPEYKKIRYRKISDNIMSKTFTISSIKKFENSLQSSVSCKEITFTREEINYKKNVLKIVNTSKKIKNKNKLNISEASIIFSSVTGSYNFPSHLNHIKKQLNKKDEYYDRHLTDFVNKTISFEPKEDVYLQKNIPNKMNFALFIKSFELIAIKLFPKMFLDDAVSLFLETKIQPFIYRRNRYIHNDNNEIQNAISKMEKPDIKKILEKLGKIIYPFFIKFTDNKKEMQFYQFFEIYTNLKLFPEMVSLSQMKQIFSILCENSNNKTNIEKVKNIKDIIDFDLFIKSLGISSMLFNFKNILSDKDRLLYIYYFILESSSINNIITNKNIFKKIQNNLKNKKGKRYLRNKSIDDLNNKKIMLNYDKKTNEYIFVSKIRKNFNFLDVYA